MFEKRMRKKDTKKGAAPAPASARLSGPQRTSDSVSQPAWARQGGSSEDDQLKTTPGGSKIDPGGSQIAPGGPEEKNAQKGGRARLGPSARGAFWDPKWSPKTPKSTKNREEFKNLSRISGKKTKKVNFLKMQYVPSKNHDFRGPEGRKIIKNQEKTRKNGPQGAKTC